MAERSETHEELDGLLRQGMRDLVDRAPPSDGLWQQIRRRIERERTTQPSDPTSANEYRVIPAHVIATS